MRSKIAPNASPATGGNPANATADKLLNAAGNKPIDLLKAVYESGIIDTRKLKHRRSGISSRPTAKATATLAGTRSKFTSERMFVIYCLFRDPKQIFAVDSQLIPGYFIAFRYLG